MLRAFAISVLTPIRTLKHPTSMATGRTAISVLFVIRSLNCGGAERQLTYLAKGLAAAGHEVCVATFYSEGPYVADLTRAGVPVVSLDKRGSWDVISFVRTLLRLIRARKPHAIYGFMPVECLVSLLASRLSSPRPTLVWGIRASDVDAGIYGFVPKAVQKLQRLFAGSPDLVISNSQAGLDCLGLGPGRGIVIPNGIDTARFRPDPESRRAGRYLLKMNENDRVVAVVGRLDPMKGHDCFLRAAAIVAAQIGDVRFLIVGSGPDAYRISLTRLADRLGISDRLIWQPEIPQIEIVYNAITVLVMSSVFGEGFSNVVAEAMACGTAVVATDVGDTVRVLGSHGSLVRRNEPLALAAGIVRALQNANAEQGNAVRNWIVDQFGIDSMVSATEAALIRTQEELT